MSGRRSYIFIALLAVLAAAVEQLIPLSVRQMVARPAEFFFLLAAIRFGPWAGLLVAIAAAIPERSLANGLFTTAEALIVGQASRRWNSTPRAALAFWLPVGIPAYLLRPDLAHLPGVERWLAAAAGASSGFLTTIAATYAATLCPCQGSSPTRAQSRPAPLRVSVLKAILVTSGLAAFLVTMTHNEMFQREAEQEVGRQLVSQATLVRNNLTEYVGSYRTALEAFGRVAVDGRQPDTGRMQRLLTAFHRQYPGFVSMMATDSGGTVVAASPQWRFDGRESTHSAADRHYFREAIQGKSFISGVFQGRGFGNDPIVAVSTPWRDDRGRIGGVVEGSLDLNALKSLELPGDSAERIQLLILDGGDRVVYRSPGLSYEPISNAGGSALLAAALQAKEPVFRHNFGGGGPWLATATRAETLGWQVVLQRSLAGVDSRIARHRALALVIMLVALLLSLLLADIIGSRFAHPLELLAQRVKRFDPETGGVAAGCAEVLERGSGTDRALEPAPGPPVGDLRSAAKADGRDRQGAAEREGSR